MYYFGKSYEYNSYIYAFAHTGGYYVTEKFFNLK